MGIAEMLDMKLVASVRRLIPNCPAIITNVLSREMAPYILLVVLEWLD
jgi:hypothetical protein